jgi:hypothetical protein
MEIPSVDGLDYSWPIVASGEVVLWRGKPLRSAYTTKDAKQSLYGIPIAAFITFWMWGALQIPKKGKEPGDFESVMPWVFVLFGSIFVLQALNLLFGHYIRNWLEWRNVQYAVTNRRAVVRKGLFSVSEISMPYAALRSSVELHTKPDGVGDIIFERRQTDEKTSNFAQAMQRAFNPADAAVSFAFYRIPMAAEVYRTLLSAISPAEARH